MPTSKNPGDVGYSSSVIKRGEGEAVVVGTGECTEMGVAAKLVSSVKKTSRYDYILFWVAMYLLVLAFTLMTIQMVFFYYIISTSFLHFQVSPFVYFIYTSL